MKPLMLVMALLFMLVPARADAFCFKEIGSAFHKEQVEQAPAYPVQIRPAGSQKAPDTFCHTVMRAAAITLLVQTFVVGLKVGVTVLTGVPIL